MTRWVEITFDCLPLRTVSRLDAPLDASPRFRARCERIKQALEKHGTHNTYYLYNAACVFHLVNHPDVGRLEFEFEGTVLTDTDDTRAISCDLDAQLVRETCDWLREPIVQWFSETVCRAVTAEFDRFIAAGDLEKARQRAAQLKAACDESGGFMGMYL
jgi:hypothetical protein